MTVMLLAVLHRRGDAHMSVAAHVLEGLTPRQRAKLVITGITPSYSQVESGLETLERAMRETVDKSTGEVTGPRLSITAHDLANDLVRATLPPNLGFTGEVAIDSTDFETDAARRSFAKHRVLADLDLPINPEQSTTQTVQEVIDDVRKHPTRNRSDAPRNTPFPILGPDNRWQHSKDPDARDGYRAGKVNSSAGKRFSSATTCTSLP